MFILSHSPSTCFSNHPSRLTPWPLLLSQHSFAATSSTYIKTVRDVEHRAKIRAICLNIFCVHSLICLFVWQRLLSRCSCPTLASLFCSPLQIAWRIQLDLPRAGSLFFFTASGGLLPREQHKHLQSKGVKARDRTVKPAWRAPCRPKNDVKTL